MYPLYIDPGTGSMLFTLFIGIATAVVFGARSLFIKLKLIFAKDKTNAIEKNKIQYVIFSDHKRYWNVFKPIVEEFESREIPITYYTASSDDPSLSNNYKYANCVFIGEGNKAIAKMNFLNAKICISTTPGLDVLQWKRSKEVEYYVHIPHSIDDVPATYKMFGLDHYDSVLTTGTHQEKVIRELEKIRNQNPKEVVCVGCTYLDEMLKRKSNLAENTLEGKTVLLAPTWGQNGLLTKYGTKLIDALLMTDYSIVVRPHPQSLTAEKDLLNELQNHYSENSRVNWNFDNDNFEILSKSDIMISDFSGVIYDYTLIFDKPVFYANASFNTSQYDADWLDEEVWTMRVLPKIGIKLKEEDFSNLQSIFDNALTSEKLKSGRDEVKTEAWHNIGESAKLICDYLIEKGKMLSN